MAQVFQVAKSLEQELLEMLARAVRTGEFEPPQLPHIAVKVLNLSRDPSVSMRSIGALLAQDPILAAKVLHLANSAAYQRGEPITSLQRAMVQVGFDSLKQLLFAYAFQGSVFRSPEFSDAMAMTWRHSVGVGLAADLIARRRKADIHLPFLAGLVHDVGRAVAINAIATMRRHSPRLQAVDHERLMQLVDNVHARLGALIAARWALPGELREVLAHHHSAVSYKGPARELVCTVGAADHVARMVGLGYGEDEPMNMEAARLFAALGLPRPDIEAIVAALEQRAQALTGAL